MLVFASESAGATKIREDIKPNGRKDKMVESVLNAFDFLTFLLIWSLYTSMYGIQQNKESVSVILVKNTSVPC